MASRKTMDHGHGAFNFLVLISLISVLCMGVDASVPYDNISSAINIAHMKSSGKSIEAFVYVQSVDHFAYGVASVTSFQQRYYIDNRYWSGPKVGGPIFVFFGGESPIDGMIGNIGLINDCAPHLGALVLYIEHRFYGKSVPLESIDLAMASPEIRSCLTTEQSLADYAEVILSVKANLSATKSSVIVVGGSYAGLLAAWFRLKYPHIATGALASSAPILAFDGITPEDASCAVVSKDFQELDKKCYNTIRRSWAFIDDIASQENGLEFLSRSFNTCRPLQSSSDLKTYLSNVYTLAAQYNGRFNTFITSVCSTILGDKDPINGIIKAKSLFVGSENSCLEIIADGDDRAVLIDTNSLKAWKWQRCTELVAPKGCSEDSMLPPSQFNMTAYTQDCLRRYTVLPRPKWITTYYGGHDMAATLRQFGSNIIFSNGLRDPLSSAGVLTDISSTIVAITTKEGSHCLDLTSSPDDPKWLVHQRQKEIRLFARWIEAAKHPNNGCKFPPSCMTILLAFSVLAILQYLM